MTLFISYYTIDIGKQLLSILIVKGRNAVLCPEHNMIQQLTIA